MASVISHMQCASQIAGADGLVSGGVVVEGSGGASMQNLVKSVLSNATATGRFSNAGLTFAPTDSDQVGHACQ